MNKKVIFISALFLVLFIFSCTKDGGLWYDHNWEKLHPSGQNVSTGGCDTSGTIGYAAKIKPILVASCNLGGCHDGSGASDYNSIATVQYDATSGQLLDRLRRTTSMGGHMPQGASSLPGCDTLKIRLWILQGALNN